MAFRAQRVSPSSREEVRKRTLKAAARLGEKQGTEQRPASHLLSQPRRFDMNGNGQILCFVQGRATAGSGRHLHSVEHQSNRLVPSFQKRKKKKLSAAAAGSSRTFA